MIGNDIIDLDQAKKESNWKRKGYLNKIYTEAEQEYILSSKNQDQIIWCLWSMKEATYKIINRKTLQRFYNPKALICRLTLTGSTKVEGQVTYKEHQYKTKTTLYQSYIHTIAIEQKSKFDNVLTLFNDTTLNIQKELFGAPFIYKNQQKKPVSLSNHGSYQSVSFLNIQ